MDLLPALLLTVVAGRQIQLARTQSLVPWKGGGFGMFSSTDGRAARYVRVFIHAAERDEELDIPPSLEDLAACVAVLPSENNLRRLAVAVAAREHRKQRPTAEVRVEVWRTSYDSGTLRPEDQLVRELTHHVE